MQVLLTNYFTFRLRCTTAWKVRPFSSSLDSVHRFERGYFLSMFIKSKFPVKDLSTFRYLTHCLEKQFIERAPSRQPFVKIQFFLSTDGQNRVLCLNRRVFGFDSVVFVINVCIVHSVFLAVKVLSIYFHVTCLHGYFSARLFGMNCL